jgi:CRP/FNR family transcriptional regulator, dissimilatory nitrate respiration regulator
MAEKLAEELRACPLFSGLGPDELEEIARNARTLRAASGTVIFREGQTSEGFYVVFEGCVRVFKMAPGGREHTLHVVRPPGSFAEAAIFAAGTYPAFAEALEDSRLAIVYREPFVRFLRERPDAAIRVIESLSRWLHRLLDKLESQTFLSARARLAAWLVREARRQGNSRGACEIDLPLAKKDLAGQLGMAPETYSRAQADLEDRRLIRAEGRRIRIADLAGLEESVLEPGGPS